MARRLPGATTAEKLALNSRRDGDCLRWTGAHTPKGYGQIVVGGRRVPVHRAAHEEWIGPIPDEHEVDHVHDRGCRFRDCIEPAHLEAVTHAENVARQLATLTECAKGHPRTPDNILIRTDRRTGYVVTRCRTCGRDERRAARAAAREEAIGRG